MDGSSTILERLTTLHPKEIDLSLERVERLMAESPLPDTGSLEGDLRTWTRSVAAGLSSREGSAFFRVVVATAPTDEADRLGRVTALGPRLQQIATVIERAQARGESASIGL